MAKNNNLFKVLDSISSKKKIKYNKKDCNGFMICMWLSHDKSLMNIISKINPYVFELPDELIYKYFYKMVPQKERYLKWTKKEKATKKQQKEIDDLCQTYDISEQEALLSLK